jgi:hypothetical protein
MAMENEVLASISRLRKNMKDVQKALDTAKGVDKDLVLATGGLSIIYANTVQLMMLDLLYQTLTQRDVNPLVIFKQKINDLLDQEITNTEKNYADNAAH